MWNSKPVVSDISSDALPVELMLVDVLVDILVSNWASLFDIYTRNNIKVHKLLSKCYLPNNSCPTEVAYFSDTLLHSHRVMLILTF